MLSGIILLDSPTRYHVYGKLEWPLAADTVYLIWLSSWLSEFYVPSPGRSMCGTAKGLASYSGYQHGVWWVWHNATKGLLPSSSCFTCGGIKYCTAATACPVAQSQKSTACTWLYSPHRIPTVYPHPDIPKSSCPAAFVHLLAKAKGCAARLMKATSCGSQTPVEQTWLSWLNLSALPGLPG